MGGDEATSLLCGKAHAKTRIALAELAMGGDREKYLEIGFNDYATKPIMRVRLIETIQQHRSGAESVPATRHRVAT